MNVRDSDGTIVFTKGTLSGGSALTIQMAQKYDKPCLHIDLNLMDEVTACPVRSGPGQGNEPMQEFRERTRNASNGVKMHQCLATAVKQIRKWLKTNKIKVLNIAGSRESESHGIYKATKEILVAVFNLEFPAACGVG